MKGFIKLSREFLENKELCKSAEHLWLYVHILSQAAYKEGTFATFDGNRIELKRGQLVTSVRRLAKETGIPKSTVARILNLFKSWDVIGTEDGTRQSLITVGFSGVCETENGTETDQDVGQSWDKVAERKDDKEKSSKREKAERKERIINKKENKEIYGIFQNVKLSQAEFDSFKAQFPINHSRYIDDLSRYIASRGDKYKSHYATLLSWNHDKSDEMKSFDTDDFFEAALKRSAERIRERANAN